MTENGNGGMSIERRYDLGGKLITSLLGICALILMFFLGMFVNNLNARVDKVCIAQEKTNERTFANEKDIATIKTDYLAKVDNINLQLASIKELIKSR